MVVSGRLTSTLFRKDLDLDALPQLQRCIFSEVYLDRQDSSVDGTTGIFRAETAGDNGVGDLLNLPLPKRLGEAFGCDEDIRPERHTTCVELIDFGLDSDSMQVGYRDDSRGNRDCLACVDVPRGDDSIDG